MTGYEIVISVVQFFTLLLLIVTLNITRGNYKARTRPYIGFRDVFLKDNGRPDELEFEVIVSNVGSLPAKNAKLKGEFNITGEENTTFECETKGSVFPSPIPEQPTWITVINEIDKDAILSGSKSLRLSMVIDYYGSGREKYWTSTSRTYDPQRNGWIDEEGNWE